MKVLLYEPFAAGHRLYHIAQLTPALRAIGCDVQFGTAESTVRSPQYQIHLAHLESEFTIVPTAEHEQIDRGGKQSFPKKFEANRFADTLNHGRPDHVLVPTASQFSTAFATKFMYRKSFADYPLPAEGLHMSPGYGYPTLTLRRKALNILQKQIERSMPWSTYHHLDPFQLAAIDNLGGSDGKFQLMPDPAPVPPETSKNDVRDHLGIPTDGRYIGCSGAIEVMKGVIEMIEAFRIAIPQIKANDRLLLAGKFKPEIEKHIEQNCQDLVRSGRIVCINRHLSEYEMEIVVSAFDIVCIAQHWRPGSSGILIRAAAAKVPVLARDRYWSGRIVPMFKLGWTCRTWETDTFAANMVSRLRDLETYQPDDSSARFVKFHSVENYQATFLRNIRQRMNLPVDPQLIDWDWVLNGSTTQESAQA